MTDNHPQIACKGLPPQLSLDNYFNNLDALEVALMGPPKLGTKGLKRWRKNFPKKNFALAAPASVTERSLVLEGCEALKPELLVLKPGVSLTPNLENRQQVEGFLGELQRANQAVTFIPTGVWPTNLCLDWVEKFALTVPVPLLEPDPLDEWLELKALSASHSSYFLLRPMRKRIKIEDIEDLIDRVNQCPSAWVSFAHDNRYPDAKRFIRELTAQ